MKRPIPVGELVAFDTDYGTQTGTVAEIMLDLGNGQKIALVEVPGTQNGAPWRMPVDQLQRIWRN